MIPLLTSHEREGFLKLIIKIPSNNSFPVRGRPGWGKKKAYLMR